MSDLDSDDENAIRYGTPLEPYEEDEVPTKRKYQEAADQYAVDAHGRRRFHGAFTGGFSAGFGNTVGSQEGWTPAAFKSSRMEKAQVSSQRPEDFMDEEDRSEFGIAPKQMQTSSEFSGQKRQRARGFHDGPIPGEPVLEQLLKPVHETAAVQMLRAMGWRQGQGTGDRLPQRAKRAARDRHKVYGCYMPPDMKPQDESDNEGEGSDSDVDFDTLYAPDDYEPYILNHKSDRFGLGYKGLSRHSVLGNLVGEYGSGDSSSKLIMKEKGKKVSIRGQAFGVGAFEADDEDIYATEDMSHYDFALGPSTAKEKAKPIKSGTNVLRGFTRSTKPFPSVASYPPPTLPRDYIPLAVANRTSNTPNVAPHRDLGLGRHELTSLARGLMLGEIPPMKNLPTPKATIATPEAIVANPEATIATPETTNAIPTNQKDVLAKIMGRNLDFVATQSSNSKETENSAPDFISIKDSGKELVNVFRPFAGNPKKQARYERYCEKGVFETDGDTDRLSEWEREREIVEFEQAAKLYRPLSGIMGDRFTHAAQPDDAINPLTAVAKSTTNYGLATPDQIEAAKKGVYGVMTRSKVAWRPDSVVCKRFNVPEPNVTRLEPKKDERPKISYSVFSYMESSVHDKDSFTKEQGKFSGSKSQSQTSRNVPTTKTATVNAGASYAAKNAGQNYEAKVADPTLTADRFGQQHIPSKRMTVAELFMKESEVTKEQGKEVTEAIEKFDKMDLYKAIFLSDSEEEDAKQTNKQSGEVSDFVDVPKNVARNLSPPRGIFANINFDELNSWRRAENPETSSKTTNESTKNEVSKKDGKNESGKNEEMEVETYGPKIPENLKKRLEEGLNNVKDIQVIDSTSDDDSDSWVDVKAVKAKKSKKKKKHKLKHKKSKHKKKDR